MKNFYKRVLITILFAFALSASVQAQEPLQEVVQYIRGGNVTGMAKYFDKMVGVNINNNQASYSASQAEIILKDFLRINNSVFFLYCRVRKLRQIQLPQKQKILNYLMHSIFLWKNLSFRTRNLNFLNIL